MNLPLASDGGQMSAPLYDNSGATEATVRRLHLWCYLATLLYHRKIAA